jgi:hypothetical protein
MKKYSNFIGEMIKDDCRLTHRRQSKNLNTGHIKLFACRGNEHYGPHCWILLSNLPPVSKKVIEFACEFYNIKFREAEKLCNPRNIVDDAGAWDDKQFVSELWNFGGEPIGFRTPDGAVVLDHHSVKLKYIYDPQ